MVPNGADYVVNTYSYVRNETAMDCLARLSGRGFRDFEFILYPGHIWPSEMDRRQRATFRRFLEEHDLRVLTMGPPALDLNLTGVMEEMREYTIDVFRSAIEMAGDLGIPGIIIVPGKAHPLLPASKQQLLDWLFNGLDRLVPLAEESGVEILVENLPAAFLPDAISMMEALSQYGDDRIGIVFDLANGAFIGEDLGVALRRVKSRLRRVHISDTSVLEFRHDRVGRGTIEFQKVGLVLQDLDCAPPLVLEIISEDPDGDIEESIKRLSEMGWGQWARR